MISFKKKLDTILEKGLLVLESLIALISIFVLVGLLVIYLIRICNTPGYFLQEDAVHQFLQELLSIVIGLEFVKLLMHMTPANILEVLIMAIARHIVVGHSDSLDTLLSILCIIALFAAKRYLIPRAEFHMELEDELPYERSYRHRSNRHKNSGKSNDASDKE